MKKMTKTLKRKIYQVLNEENDQNTQKRAYYKLLPLKNLSQKVYVVDTKP